MAPPSDTGQRGAARDGASTTPPDVQALGRRLGLFALLLASILTTAFVLLALRDYWIWRHVDLLATWRLVALGMIGTSAVFWRLSLGPTRTLRQLLALDVAQSLLLGLAFAGIAMVVPRPPIWQAATLITLARAAMVPSNTRRTALISTAMLAPLIVVGGLKDMRLENLSQRYALTFALEYAVNVATVVALAALISRVLFDLRRRLGKARKLGRYTLEHEIGAGGMGVVYRARHAMLRRPTAIKLLVGEGGADLARFELEVQRASALTHPNSAAIYDYGRTPDNIFYYAMELLDGRDVQRVIDEHGAQPPARAIHILRQVCGALAEAHDLGLVHGDIKPANIMLCRCYGGVPDVAKVLDYGLSQAATKVGVADDLRALGRVGVALLGDEGPPDLAALLQRCSGDQGAALSNARALERALASCADAEGWSRAHAENWWQSVRDQQPDQASSPPSTRRPDELSVDPAHRSTP